MALSRKRVGQEDKYGFNSNNVHNLEKWFAESPRLVIHILLGPTLKSSWLEKYNSGA